MKITVEFELPDSYAACFCNDKDRIDSLIGSVDKDFTYSIIPSELLEQRDELLKCLIQILPYIDKAVIREDEIKKLIKKATE